MALDEGKPITDERRTAASLAAERAMKDSPGSKAMAEKLIAVLKLFPKTDGFVNSLGMKFVPVPGTKVLFSIWDTRVQDYRAYAQANSGIDGSWGKKPDFTQGEDHPVVYVSWSDAKEFCAWLSRKEGKTYRLPTDSEWSEAVGLKESRSGTPKEKDKQVEGVYPWGTSWPPPSGAGNYEPSLNVDNYAKTSPVGSFGANQFGLYDMSGNVLQWCADYYDGQSNTRVLRGAHWNSDTPNNLMSSRRYDYPPNARGSIYGFRCVLETGRAP